LVVTGGDLDGTSFIVMESSKDMLLGSSQDCHFQVLLGNVEPVHAKVAWGPKGLLLSDALSATGTFVNGEKIAENHVLSDGDRICLGPPGSKNSCKLVVRIPAGLSYPAEEELVLVKPETGLQPFAPKEGPAASSATGDGEPGPAAAAPPTAPELPLPPPPPSPPERAPAPEETRRAARTETRPEYVTAPPSIAPERAAETPPPPPRPAPRPAPPRPAARPAAKRAPKPRGSRLPLYLVLGLAAAAGLFYAGRTLLRRPPLVESASPPRSEPGQTITLSGKGFDSSPAGNTVRFGDRAAAVTSASSEKLAVTIPPDLPIPAGGEVQVVVERAGLKSAPFPFKMYRAPRVAGLEPDVAMPGDEILIKGQNLDGKPLTVSIGGMPAEVKEAVPASVRVVVPQLPVAQGKVVTVSVQIGPDSAKPADLTVGYLPLVAEVRPDKGQAGEKAVIKGRGFDADAEDNEVYFGDQPALILAASETELTVIAPPAVSAQAQVTTQVYVKANGAISSSPAMFTHLRPSATVFLPRFYAAAVLAYPQFAFVSTDLGPVIVLGGGETDVEATANRAVAVAASLNALAEGAASSPPTFEVRQQPSTAVAAQGREAPIVEVTAEDAAAYELPFEPGAKARRPSVRGLATYWAALFQDYFSLFVQKQRPVAVLALSPRGRVLTEIYAAAQRVPSATGVPQSVVRPLSPSMARSLRDMALLLPAEKESRVSVAVEGLWAGTMEEASGGAKNIQVRFELKGGRLGGTLTTRSGKVELTTPLREVAFQKNEVRFAAEISGSTRAFTGTVQGGTLAGTIAKGADKAAGRFSLRYVE
jgi:hypothetical protein